MCLAHARPLPFNAVAYAMLSYLSCRVSAAGAGDDGPSRSHFRRQISAGRAGNTVLEHRQGAEPCQRPVRHNGGCLERQSAGGWRGVWPIRRRSGESATMRYRVLAVICHTSDDGGASAVAEGCFPGVSVYEHGPYCVAPLRLPFLRKSRDRACDANAYSFGCGCVAV